MSHGAHHLHFLLSPSDPGALGFAAGLVAGLASSLHCLAMCGAIATALSLRGAPAGASGGALLAGRMVFLTQAQMARIGVYLAFGITAGLIGAGLSPGPVQAGGLTVLRWMSGAVLMTMGLSLAGWSPFGGLGARLAGPVTRRLHHLHRFGAPGLGLVWGLMPCSMVWMMTLYAGLSGSPLQGGLIMAGFGLGTAVILSAAAGGANALASLARRPAARIAAGLVLMALAVASLL